MLSDNKRLSLLIRKNNGRRKLDDYRQFFKGFNLKRLEYIELEQSDEIRDQIRNIFIAIEIESEMFDNEESQVSLLLEDIFNKVSNSDTCYIFTDDVYECGMFKATTQSALKNCLNIAFLAYNNTCFLIDCDFKFSFTINYYDEDHMDYPHKFEVQRRIIKAVSQK